MTYKKDQYKARYPIKSLVKAMEIVDVLAKNTRGLSISEIESELQIGKSTIHRILDTLMTYDRVEKDVTTNKYFLGWRMFEIGSNIPKQRNLYSFDRQILHDLCTKYGETINLGVRDSRDVVTIYKVEPDVILKADFSMVGREALHATAMGKILISEFSEAELMEIYGKEKELIAYTRNTIASLEKLEDELGKIAKQGYAIDDEESCIGLYCVAMPIRNNKGKIVCAISVSGPTARIDFNKIQDIKEGLKIAVTSMSKYLGYRGQHETL